MGTTKKGEGFMAPLMPYNFKVVFKDDQIAGSRAGSEMRADFSEVTGLEATMEPKEIKEGGRNYGSLQRAGPISFSTVVFKRGVIRATDAWKWFAMSIGGDEGYRKTATISVYGPDGKTEVWKWELQRCLPVKFKTADLNANSGEVAIEELHVAHEGLAFKTPSPPKPTSGDKNGGAQ